MSPWRCSVGIQFEMIGKSSKGHQWDKRWVCHEIRPDCTDWWLYRHFRFICHPVNPASLNRAKSSRIEPNWAELSWIELNWAELSRIDREMRGGKLKPMPNPQLESTDWNITRQTKNGRNRVKRERGRGRGKEKEGVNREREKERKRERNEKAGLCWFERNFWLLLKRVKVSGWFRVGFGLGRIQFDGFWLLPPDSRVRWLQLRLRTRWKPTWLVQGNPSNSVTVHWYGPLLCYVIA